MTPNTLLTSRLRLRPPADSDTSLAEALLSNTKTRRYLGGIVDPSHLKSRAIEAIAPASNVHHWIAETLSHTPLGLLTLSPHKDGRDIELSYQFLPQHWGQGYASEACTALLCNAHQQLAFTTLIAETQAANTRSTALLHRLGFTRERGLTRFGEPQIIFRITFP